MTAIYLGQWNREIWLSVSYYTNKKKNIKRVMIKKGNGKQKDAWWTTAFTPQKSQPTPMWTFESGSDHQSVFSGFLPPSNEPERKQIHSNKKNTKKKYNNNQRNTKLYKDKSTTLEICRNVI